MYLLSVNAMFKQRGERKLMRPQGDEAAANYGSAGGRLLFSPVPATLASKHFPSLFYFYEHS